MLSVRSSIKVKGNCKKDSCLNISAFTPALPRWLVHTQLFGLYQQRLYTQGTRTAHQDTRLCKLQQCCRQQGMSEHLGTCSSFLSPVCLYRGCLYLQPKGAFLLSQSPTGTDLLTQPGIQLCCHDDIYVKNITTVSTEGHA